MKISAVGIYRAMWGPTTRRPFTYVFRQTPGWKVAIGTTLSLGALYGLSWLFGDVVGMVILTAGLIAGYVAGHLFWDTKGTYIKHADEFSDGKGVNW